MLKQTESIKDFGILILEPVLDIKRVLRIFSTMFLTGYMREKKTP